MRCWTLWLALLALSLFSCRDASAPSADVVLTIVSPHHDHIQTEFADAFRTWYRATYGESVEVRFQQRGGTSDIVRYVTSEFASKRASGTADEGIGIDVFFGGGLPAAEALKAAGCTVAITLPADVLALQPAELAGIPMRDPERHWYGNVLAAFGIVFNKKALTAAGVSEPSTWTDLASESMSGRVILADPNKSASIAVCFELILQKQGWERGWATLMRIGGNTREFKPTSSQVAPDVAQGVGWAGMCIAVYGHSQIGKSGSDLVGYVSPVGATAYTPDPIAVLRGCRDLTLATRFVTFTLSEPGQALWTLPAGHPNGPKAHTLYRMPAIPLIYDKYAEAITVPSRPFADPTGFVYDAALERRRSPLIGPLIRAAFLKNLDLSRRAWQAVIDSKYDAALVAEFEKPPFDEQEGLQLAREHHGDPRRALELDRQWYEFFRAKYERLLSQ